MGPAVFEDQVKVRGRKSSVDWALNALIEHFGNKHVRTIKPSDLANYKKIRLSGQTWRGTKRTIATVNRELALLRTMLNFALHNDWIIQTPFAKITGIISLSAEVQRDRVLTFDEERRLLEVCDGPRRHLQPILICALDTAMRRGEIFKMKWEDVDLGSGEIHIPQTNTKTEEARAVGITQRLREELVKLWEVSPKQKDSLVFGKIDSIKTSWKTACKLANIEDFRFHDCRHTATTRMIASGSPHTEVMKITGHTQIKAFLRYLNIITETANRVANRLDVYLEGREQTIEVKSDLLS